MPGELPPVGAGMATSQNAKKPAKGADVFAPVLKNAAEFRSPMKSAGPKFNDEATIKFRRRLAEDKVVANNKQTLRVADARVAERRYLRAQYEFEREKRLAERIVYHVDKTQEWRKRLQSSPLRVDLYGDGKRVFSEHRSRESEMDRLRKRNALLNRRERSNKQQDQIAAVATSPDVRSAATMARHNRREMRRQHEAEQRELAEMRERQREEDERRAQEERDRAAIEAEWMASAALGGEGEEKEEKAEDGEEKPEGTETDDEDGPRGEVGKGAPDIDKEGGDADGDEDDNDASRDDTGDVSDDRSSYKDDDEDAAGEDGGAEGEQADD